VVCHALSLSDFSQLADQAVVHADSTVGHTGKSVDRADRVLLEVRVVEVQVGVTLDIEAYAARVFAVVDAAHADRFLR
jgi:hypothetical protein